MSVYVATVQTNSKSVITVMFNVSLDQLGLLIQGLWSSCRARVECFFVPNLRQINIRLICSLCACVSLSGLLNWSGFNAVSDHLSRRGHVGLNYSTFCFLATNLLHWSDKSSCSLDVTWKQLLSLCEQNLCLFIFYV